MKIAFKELWRPSGTIGRGTYALIGVVGFVLKHNLDRLVATFGFHRPWGVFNYWIPLRDVVRITQLHGDEPTFLGTLVVLSLPFVWLGVALTMKRLRDANLPLSLVALFFAPFLNLLFFLVLCLVPGIDGVSERPHKAKPSLLSRVIPKDPLGSAVTSLLVTVPIGFGMALLGSQLLLNYGWGLFVALPFSVGFTSVLIFEFHERRRMWSSIGVACLATTLLGLALMALAFEGAFCLIMIIPLALPLAIMGGVCAHSLMAWRNYRHDAPAFMAVMVLFVPGIQWLEHTMAAPPTVYVVHTQLDIQAPPQKVWKQVVAFSQIPPPKEWLFRAGIAYPIQAQMIGSGVGAERHCVFSTGAFVEPIQVWDEPHLLKFSVTSNPAPMEEWTPYHHIEPPHLHGFLMSEGGQFLLTPLPNGGTRLEGTTWYQHGLWPAAYWRVWSDAIIHRIHLRVLNHIRDEVENQAQVKPKISLAAPNSASTSLR